jgi:hypothetical protein
MKATVLVGPKLSFHSLAGEARSALTHHTLSVDVHSSINGILWRRSMLMRSKVAARNPRNPSQWRSETFDAKQKREGALERRNGEMLRSPAEAVQFRRSAGEVAHHRQ